MIAEKQKIIFRLLKAELITEEEASILLHEDRSQVTYWPTPYGSQDNSGNYLNPPWEITCDAS